MVKPHIYSHTKTSTNKDPHMDRQEQTERRTHGSIYNIVVCVCVYVQAQIYDVCMCVTCVRGTWPAVVTGSEAFNGI